MEENDTITDGGVAPQCSFARPTKNTRIHKPHIEHLDTRKYLEHKKRENRQAYAVRAEQNVRLPACGF